LKNEQKVELPLKGRNKPNLRHYKSWRQALKQMKFGLAKVEITSATSVLCVAFLEKTLIFIF